MAITVYPIHYQSGNFSFFDWISLLTLCLAPLIAHIIAGCPQPSYLCNSRPKWHERIGHYNPTSILWRYAIIADRRIRAKSWNPLEMAAANALFWTSNGWDGSEDIATTSLEHCTHLPATAHTEIASVELLKTVIVTLQGLSAVVILSRSFTGQFTDPFTEYLGVDSIFWPFSIIGLVRLCCALWLTDNYSFSRLTLAEFYIQTDTKIETVRRASFDSLLEQPNIKDKSAEQRFRAISYWPSRAFRIMFFLVILGLLVLSFIWISPANGSSLYFTATALITELFYMSIFSVTTLIFAFYLFQDRKTTIIPCINSPWYKAYTVFVMVSALVLFIVASIETKRTACGLFTSDPLSYDMASVCSSGWTPIYFLDPKGDPEDYFFGFTQMASPRWQVNHTASGQKNFWVYNLTGYCMGFLSDPDLGQLATTLEVVNFTAIEG